MAEILDYWTGDSITQGLQGSSVCDEAINLAREIAAERGTTVHLIDDDGEWAVRANGTREPLTDEDAIDDEDILELSQEAARAGDLMQVAICRIALELRPYDRPAIEFARERNLLLCMHNSPIEAERFDMDPEEAEEVVREALGLVYLDLLDLANAGFDAEWAREECESVIWETRNQED